MTSAGGLDDYIDLLGPDDRAVPGRNVTAVGPRRVAGTRTLPPLLARPYALVRAIPDGGVYLGVVLVVIGFVLLAICWGKVAGLTAVGLQLPYLASAGMTGLGLIVTGVAIVSAASREKDAALRRAQMSELAGTLRELRLLLTEPATAALFAPPPPPPAADTVPPGEAELTTELVAITDEPLEPLEPRVPGRATASRAKTSRATTPERRVARKVGR